MISKECKITVSGNTASIDSEIYLYKNDMNIKYLFNIVNGDYAYTKDSNLDNIINANKASYAQIKFKKEDIEIDFDVQETSNGKVILLIKKELIDEDTELGDYTIQIRLFDESKTSVITLPPVNNCIHIMRPIFEKVDGSTNVVDEAAVDEAIVTYSEPMEAIASDGTFAKKTWVAKEKITTAELNRMEEGIAYNNSQYKDIAKKTITTEERTKLSSLENYDDSSVKNDIQIQKARIDAFTALKDGSTTGDAELIDARIGVNGTNYSNLGDSIRSQLDYIVDISPNLYEFNNTGLYTESGITNASTKYWHSKPIACKIGDVFRISKRVSWQSSWIGVLDKNGNKIDTLSDGNLTPWLQKGGDSVNYDTITISEFNYNGAIVNKDNIGFLIISFSAYDSVTDSNKNIIVKNCDFPEQFIEKGSTLQSCVKFNEIHKKSIQNISDEQIREFNKPIKKAIVLLNFDAFNFDDKRFEILQEYGFKATVTFGTQATPVYNEEKANKYKKVMTNGWDIGIYSAPNWVKDKYGNEAFTSTSDEVVKAWDDYVKLALEDAELNGVYYPQTWFCRQNAYCDALGKSLRKYGFKMCRGEDFTDYKKTPMYFNNDYSFVTRTKGLYPSTVEGCLWEIDQCVNDIKGVSIFSHGIYATDEDAETNFGCTETNLRTVLDRIKKYVDEGKLEVLTYNELYNRYNLNDSININYNRILKMLTNN